MTPADQPPAEEEPNWEDLALKAGKAFTPNTPIDEKALFAGRDSQIRRVVDAINQKGQHAILFGERGVGKTSLANVLEQYLPTAGESEATVITAPRVNCDSGDSFATVWHKLFEQIELSRTSTGIGFGVEVQKPSFSPLEFLGDNPPTTDSVRRALTVMANDSIPIMIVDEFDRLKSTPRRAFADLIKSLSDHAVGATVVLVGVADSVDGLIEDHESIARALVQILMPRMDRKEIRQILKKGFKSLGMVIDTDALEYVVELSQGLPHYAHLLGKHTARAALDDKSLHMSMQHVSEAINKATQDAQHSIRTAHHTAIVSLHKGNLFADVLLACALAEPNDMGYFAAQDVREPMRRITGKKYNIPAFAQHLTEFADPKRGKVLERKGEKRSYRYRFRDPLMQPFVIMQGVVDGKLPPDFFESKGA
jgi:Cdc6-like AAA superfamily ATPase